MLKWFVFSCFFLCTTYYIHIKKKCNLFFEEIVAKTKKNQKQ